MSLNLISNSPAQVGLRILKTTEQQATHLMHQISSGFKVRVATDDAAGMAVGTALKAEVSGLSQAADNIAIGLNMLQTADSAFGVVSYILIRLEDLAMEASSDGIADSERSKLDLEFQQLLAEIDRLSDSTNFNGMKLLGGSSSIDATDTYYYRVGTGIVADSGSPIADREVDTINTLNVKLPVINTTTLGLRDILSNDGNAGKGTYISIGATNRFNGGTSDTSVYTDSRREAVQALEILTMTGDRTFTFAEGAGFGNNGAGGNTLQGGSLSILENARATVGAYMNRLELASEITMIAKENAESSRSTIMDADIPTALAELASKTVLLEAGFSMLAKANQIPQSIMGLLRQM